MHAQASSISLRRIEGRPDLVSVTYFGKTFPSGATGTYPANEVLEWINKWLKGELK